MDPDLDVTNPNHIETLRRLYKVHINVIKMMDRMGYDISAGAVFFQYANKSIGLSMRSMVDFLDPGLYPNLLTGNPGNPGSSILETNYNAGYFRSRQKFSTIFTRRGTEMVLYKGPRAPLETKNQIAVIYLSSDKNKDVNQNDFRVVDVYARQFSIRNFILISEYGLNSARMKYIKGQEGTDYTLFLDVELAFDRTKHALVPLYTRVTKAADVATFEKEEDINSKKLPLIIEDDAYGRLLGIKKGDVLTNVVMGTAFEKDIFYELTRGVPQEKT